MPFRSQKQRRWMFANKPAMARRWARHEKQSKKRGNKKRRRR